MLSKIFDIHIYIAKLNKKIPKLKNILAMEIPNYDKGIDANTKYKQLYDYMPNAPFRMLMASPSDSGKTNTLIHMLQAPLVFYDKIYLYERNLEQKKYQQLSDLFDMLSQKVNYPIMEVSNDKGCIQPLEALDRDSQKIVIFDDFITEKNQKPIVKYFTGGRHRNCSSIYLSQSYYNTPKTIRLNCTHFCIGEFPTKQEQNSICNELGVTREQYVNATYKPYSFLYVDKPKKTAARNFYGDV